MITSTIFQNFLTSEQIYHPYEIEDVLKMVRPNFRFSWSNKKLKYFNVPCSFDIETTSFIDRNGEKTAVMYAWSFCLYGAVIIGRTWREFIVMINTLSRLLDLKEEKRLIIFVHNLSYEFQFIRKYFNWDKVFSMDVRKPLYAVTDNGIEFRCSYLLSGYNLAKLADQLHDVKLDKKIGDLDYSLLRHSKTPLTDAEIGYCVNDVRIVAAYIAEKADQDGGIALLPLTKTGYVRRYCKDACFYEPDKPKKKSAKRARYKEIINGMTLEPDEYQQLKRAFQGGFTHANPMYSGKVMQDVTSYDFTSSYPAVMIAERYPMSKAEMVDITSSKEFYHNLRYYCCLFDIEFNNLQSRYIFDSYISSYKCYRLDKAVINNGRVVSADKLCTTITEQDFVIIKAMYKWDSVRIANFRRYKRDYLPTDFVKSILQLYENKTVLKGVACKEIEYLNSKEMVNSCYGMTVTDIVRPEIVYEDGWHGVRIPDLREAIDKYNSNQGRFLFYPWGVWVTAYARRNLFTGILEFKEDYIYSDTDSLKVLHAADHTKYLSRYNDRIIDKLHRAMDYHGLDHSLISPATVKGAHKPLGVWDFDGSYDRFKTLGAKRYMVEYADTHDISITVSGLNKKICVPYIIAHSDDPFSFFNRDMYIPAGATGKNTHTYIDEVRTGVLRDYLGTECEYTELSAVHMEGADYSLSIAREYADYLSDVQEVSI